MTAISITPGYPNFSDTDGSSLNDGYVFVGIENQNPITAPVTLFWDRDLTISADQPLRTSGGYIIRNGTPAAVYTGADYSILVQNKNLVTVYNSPSAVITAPISPVAITSGTIDGAVIGGVNPAAITGTTITATTSVTGLTVVSTNDATINGILVGKGSGNATGNTVVGLNALSSNDPAGNYNTVFGQSALELNTTASNNTAIGYATLSANTTGADNVALGRNALLSNTTGTSNVALGMEALLVNTSGAINVAVGKNALRANTTGDNNTAVGTSALYANITGTLNVAIGSNSLASNTTGSNNVAVGKAALAANTSGIENVAVGKSALEANTSGLANVAVGVESLLTNSTGSANTFIGNESGKLVTTGSSNQAMGAGSLENLTTGSNNVGIGVSAGAYTTLLTTGSNNVLVGHVVHTSAAGTDYATGVGFNLSCEGGYTTLGQDASDIRAAHGNVTWATVSDERYKQDIVDSTAGLSFINALRPRTFKYKTLGELPETFGAYEADSTEVFKNSDTNHGFIAQEVKAAIDADSSLKDGFRLWDDREDGSQEVAEAALIPVLVKAIQELKAELDEYKASHP